MIETLTAVEVMCEAYEVETGEQITPAGVRAALRAFAQMRPTEAMRNAERESAIGVLRMDQGSTWMDVWAKVTAAAAKEVGVSDDDF